MSNYLEIARSVTQKQATGKGWAIELWRDGDQFFVVADEEDQRAAIAREVGSSGEVWTAREIELVAQIHDQGFRDEIQRWKRAVSGTVRSVG